MLTSHRRSTRNRLAAEPAKPSVVSTVSEVCGPASSVTGASSTPGSSIEVFHITLMPCGAFIAAVTSAGSLPCVSAVASYRMNHAKKSASFGFPATVCDAGSAHSRQVTATAASR